jgi:uncharacterized protein (DUF2249 family)
MIVVDVRNIPPRERHPFIFSSFDELEVNDWIELLNDHDPKPLHYQFMHERPEEFSWEYIESGPVVWKVHIRRIADAEAGE